jgi:hypothetical protein
LTDPGHPITTTPPDYPPCDISGVGEAW